MPTYLEKLPEYAHTLRKLKETIITNIVFLGQEPAPTFKEQTRSQLFLDRLSDFGVDECTIDGYQNPIGIIRGTAKDKAPIFVVAHMDTAVDKDVNHNYVVSEETIKGAGIMDNAVGVGVLASLPFIFKSLGLQFESDIVLAGDIQSIGRGNLKGIRHLLKTWSTPIRGAVCIEGGEVGRLNYSSYGMIRGEIECAIPMESGFEPQFKPNAILILNEIINQILKLRLPQRPRSRVIIGRISGGHKHGLIAYDATLGFEIQSDSDQMVKTIFGDIRDIVNGAGHEYRVDLKLNTISSLHASRIGYAHPLVKSAVAAMHKLDLKPVSEPSESELSIFLSHDVPAVTLGVTRGRDYHLEGATMEIDPMFSGIAQILGVILAIDSGVCDGV
ncbi:MAG: peptidase dimerization domain-containing protein [Thermodesulfobacteriota bacterium]